MRVNHAGEMAAQALYSGQALVARSAATRRQLADRGRRRARSLGVVRRTPSQELGGRKSVLDPLWYAGSFCVGVLAGFRNDTTSLGFVVETESQVEAHLQDHLRRLPESDAKSHAILLRMSEDEAHHGTMASLAAASSCHGSLVARWHSAAVCCDESPYSCELGHKQRLLIPCELAGN